MIETVAEVLRRTAADVVLPRYRALAAHEIEEKSPGDLVTIADREAEARIAQGVAGLVPGARFVGEEACARDASLLDGIGEGTVWIVDPIDGTGNFAAGRSPFALMVALLREGEIAASWIHDPLSGQMVVAERGGGAWLDGERLAADQDSPGLARLRGVVSRFALPETMTAGVASIEAAIGEVADNRRCAGAEYPRIATGERDFALFWRTIVWDHAPGVLILTEAGGVARRLDNTPYRPAEPGTGLVLARNPAIADEITALLGR